MYLYHKLGPELNEFVQTARELVFSRGIDMSGDRFDIIANRFKRGFKAECRSHPFWWKRVPKGSFNAHGENPHQLISSLCADGCTGSDMLNTELSIANGYLPENRQDPAEVALLKLLWSEGHEFLTGDRVLQLTV